MVSEANELMLSQGENGVIEKPIDQIKVELDIEENGAELAPMGAQRKQMQNTALR